MHTKKIRIAGRLLRSLLARVSKPLRARSELTSSVLRKASEQTHVTVPSGAV